MEFIYEPVMNRWEHPVTGVTIDDEDMPDELLPPRRADRRIARNREQRRIAQRTYRAVRRRRARIPARPARSRHPL